MRKGMIGFNPMNEGTFFWSCDGAWGTFSYEKNRAELKVLYGSVELKMLGLPEADKVRSLLANAKDMPFTADADAVCFDNTFLSEGSVLIAEF